MFIYSCFFFGTGGGLGHLLCRDSKRCVCGASVCIEEQVWTAVRDFQSGCPDCSDVHCSGGGPAYMCHKYIFCCQQAGLTQEG